MNAEISTRAIRRINEPLLRILQFFPSAKSRDVNSGHAPLLHSFLLVIATFGQLQL